MLYFQQIFVLSRHTDINGEVFDFDISDLESLCIDTPEELCHSVIIYCWLDKLTLTLAGPDIAYAGGCSLYGRFLFYLPYSDFTGILIQSKL